MSGSLVTRAQAEVMDCCGPPTCGKVARMQQGPMSVQRRVCAVTECMAWRWEGTFGHDQERMGFCGLAGKPRTE